jgi:uncharacterized protein (DUF302 family)
MRKDVEVINRPVRQITIRTGRSWRQFRDDYERAVPLFDRLEAVGVARSGGDWEAIRQLSDVTAVNGFVNFSVFDPSPVMHVNGSTGNAVTYLTGNIVKAEPGFRRQPACFLHLPLRVVIAAADDEGEATLSVDHPADLFAAYSDAALDAVAAEFCAALAALLAHLGLPVPAELINIA